MSDFKTLRQFLSDAETSVVPGPALVQNDIAQDIAKMLFAKAEEQAADVAAEAGGKGFGGDAIKHEAAKILQRTQMFLDDLIKQG